MSYDKSNKAPPLTESRNLHKKKGGRPKKFGIEAKFNGMEDKTNICSFLWRDYTDWYIYSKYKTAKARDEALDCLRKRASYSHSIYYKWEYRAVNL